MALDERRVCIEGEGAVRVEHSYGGRGIPCDGDHLSISCTAIIFVRVGCGNAIESHQGREVHVLERMLNSAYTASPRIKLSHHPGSLTHVLKLSVNHLVSVRKNFSGLLFCGLF